MCLKTCKLFSKIFSLALFCFRLTLITFIVSESHWCFFISVFFIGNFFKFSFTLATFLFQSYITFTNSNLTGHSNITKNHSLVKFGNCLLVIFEIEFWTEVVIITKFHIPETWLTIAQSKIFICFGRISC